MVEITKEEAMYLREHGADISRTCKLKNNGKKRSKYFCAEERKSFALLDEFRKNVKILETYPN